MPQPKGRVLPQARAWRERRWLTQLELSDVSGVKLATIQRAERGGPVSTRTVKALAKALEVAPDDLCEDGKAGKTSVEEDRAS